MRPVSPGLLGVGGCQLCSSVGWSLGRERMRKPTTTLDSSHSVVEDDACWKVLQCFPQFCLDVSQMGRLYLQSQTVSSQGWLQTCLVFSALGAVWLGWDARMHRDLRMLSNYETQLQGVLLPAQECSGCRYRGPQRKVAHDVSI